MELMVAYRDDPAGYNMAKFITKNLENDNDVFHGKNFDLAIISTPTISADWLEEKFHYDGFIFLSKHASESGTLALTCHSTGNFDIASFGGNPKQIAIPHPNFQKTYLKNLSNNHESFPDFQITIEGAFSERFIGTLEASDIADYLTLYGDCLIYFTLHIASITIILFDLLNEL